MFWQYFFTLLSLSILFVGFLVFVIFVFFPVAFIFACWYMRIKERKMQRRKHEGANVAFFHPYCNAGGGGERVLWVAIKALLVRYPDTNIYIYTVETAEAKKILDKVQNTFNVKIDPEKINFIRLKMKRLIEAKTYPYFTIILQSLGSMVLGLEAFVKLNPDVYIDTTGFAFTFPIFQYLAACPVGCYVHYPTITGAMMRRVKHRISAYNNSSFVARNPVITWLKLFYYKIFGWLYGVVGRCADVVMVNGAWTEEHLNETWGVSMHRVYPPCEVGELKQLNSLVKDKDPVRLLSVAQLQDSDHPLTQSVDDLKKEVLPNTGESERERQLDYMLRDMDPIRIISVAQFRPEKDHPLMLQAMYELRTLLQKNELLWSKIKLVLVGSCRNAEDEERVRNLKDLASHLALDDNVSFVVNASYGHLLTLYQTSTVALHAMANEHFGISVVECMAAGLVTIAHRSGGPLYDIIETSAPSRTGFLAAEAEEYARAVLEVIALWPAERQEIVKAARASVDRFSTPEFEKCFLRVIEPLMKTQ